MQPDFVAAFQRGAGEAGRRGELFVEECPSFVAGLQAARGVQHEDDWLFVFVVVFAHQPFAHSGAGFVVNAVDAVAVQVVAQVGEVAVTAAFVKRVDVAELRRVNAGKGAVGMVVGKARINAHVCRCV